MVKLADKFEDERAPARARFRPKVRGRGWPVALVGLAVALACAFCAWAWASASSSGEVRQVLVAARAMPAGHVIAQADLAETGVEAEGLELLGADQAGAVLGQTLALPVVVGAPLTPSMIGPAAVPAPGRAVTTLALPDGSYPGGIEPGQSVVLLAGAADTAAVWQMAAVVRSVTDLDGSVLVGLEFDAADRTGLAVARASDPFLVAWTADLPVEAGG